MSIIHLGSLELGDPSRAWLLVLPALLLPLWVWRIVRHRRDVRSFRTRGPVPIAERIPTIRPWAFWLCAIGGLGLATLAIAKPQAAVGRVRTAGLDVVVLQDGSASMHVTDVAPDRWQRSVRFLRVLAESLRWEDDRIAMALFAHIAAPQVRLTRDPNTFFFFLDHLDREPPFPLKADSTWDTNIELGIYWGTRLIEKDEALNGRSPNARIFVLVSDGEAWSGQMERALRLARSKDITLFAVGVGTVAGGYIPEAPIESNTRQAPRADGATSPLHASLDRASLLTIATAGGGQYFDLDRQSDRDIASTIIDAGRRRAGNRGARTVAEDLYWPCLAAAACLLCLSVLCLRDRGELWLQTIGAAATIVALWMVTR